MTDRMRHWPEHEPEPEPAIEDDAAASSSVTTLKITVLDLRKIVNYLAVGLLILLLSNAGGLVYAYTVESRLEEFQDEFDLLRVQRNQQLEDIREQNRSDNCTLLDGLPQGPLFDPTREANNCDPGNGVAASELSPEQADQLRDFADDMPIRANPDARSGGTFSAPIVIP